MPQCVYFKQILGHFDVISAALLKTEVDGLIPSAFARLFHVSGALRQQFQVDFLFNAIILSRLRCS